MKIIDLHIHLANSRVGWGKMSMVGQNEYGGAKQVTGNFYLYAKN